ncbi:MAG: NAD(+) synthase [Schleiferiaceae bacterium]|nr:NAD(+) synthase [Schleiferiaceae bacterium]
MNLSQIDKHIVGWLSDYAMSSGVNGFVVGVSGGVDSALTSSLCASTQLETHLLELPIHQAQSQSKRAYIHMKSLKETYGNVYMEQRDLTLVFDSLVSTLNLSKNHNTELSLANARARVRMTTLYAYAQNHNLLVIGTGNKIEDFGVGFYTKYGDGGVDISPIADLFKSEVFELAKYKGVSQTILDAAPTDGLWKDERNDEDQIGATYPELEVAMKWVIEKNWNLLKDDINNILESNLKKREKEVLLLFIQFHRSNSHKMLPIPVCEIPKSYKRGKEN